MKESLINKLNKMNPQAKVIADNDWHAVVGAKNGDEFYSVWLKESENMEVEESNDKKYVRLW